VYEHNYEWAQALTEFETGVRLRRPDDVEPLIQYGRILSQVGRVAEALKQFLVARRVEPASALVSSHVSHIYYFLGQMDSALVESERALQSDSTVMTALTLGAQVRFKAGHIAEAHDLAIRSPSNGGAGGGFYVLAATGDTAAAMARLRKAESVRPRVWMVETARFSMMLGLGDTARALDALERATAAREIWPSTAPVPNPIFDVIRGSARFQAILREVGLSSVGSAWSSRSLSR
jgi:tetratricopeptide (TPR) repeat protein